jgi:hypothetical protein
MKINFQLKLSRAVHTDAPLWHNTTSETPIKPPNLYDFLNEEDIHTPL